VRVVGGVEQILSIEFAEDNGKENVADGDDALWIGTLGSLETREGAFIVERVEVLEGVADLRGEVDWIGVGGRIEGLAMGRGCQQKSENQAQSFSAAFYFFFS
jgi:hypothetical protein